MLMEVRNGEDYYLSDIYIFDMANYTLQHVPRITFTHVKKYELCAIVSFACQYVQILTVSTLVWSTLATVQSYVFTFRKSVFSPSLPYHKTLLKNVSVNKNTVCNLKFLGNEAPDTSLKHSWTHSTV
jgi:hypothetical protein